MWMLNYLVCLTRGHVVTSIVCQGPHRRHHYHYCLRCSRVKTQGRLVA